MFRLVVAPLYKEFDLLTKAIESIGYTLQKKTPSKNKIRTCENLGTIYVCGGRGKVDFALSTYHYLKEYPHIKEVIGVGSCGALSKNLKTQDIVIGKKIIEHDYKKKFMASPSPPQFETSAHWLLEIQKKYEESRFSVIASGDEDIMDKQRAFELRESTGADVVAWEGAGGARACLFAKVNYLEVRGVTDFSDSQTPQTFKECLEGTMTNLAQTLIRIPQCPK